MAKLDGAVPQAHVDLLDGITKMQAEQRAAFDAGQPVQHRRGATIRIAGSLIDGWKNILTGLGGRGDTRKHNRAWWGSVMYEEDAENLYAADNTARRIVDLLPKDCTREGIEFNDEMEAQPIKDELQRLDWQSKSKKAWEYARLYGGALIVKVDGHTPLENWDEEWQEGQEIKSLVVLSRWEAWAYATEIQRDIMEPDYGEPLKYRLFPRTSFGQTAFEIHASRVIRFDGKLLPILLHIRNNFWGDSVLTSLEERLGDWKATAGYVASTLRDFRLLVHKIKGLSSSIMAKADDKIRKRLAIMNESKSVLGAYAIDADDDMTFQNGNLSGIAEAAQIVKDALAAETEYPHSILFNEPAGKQKGMGSSGKGDHEETIWFDIVHEAQVYYYKPKLDSILKDLLGYLPGVKGKKLADFPYDFAKLWQEDDGESATTYKTNAEGDQIYLNLGVRTPEYVQRQRFPEEYSEKPAASAFVEQPDPQKQEGALADAVLMDYSPDEARDDQGRFSGSGGGGSGGQHDEKAVSNMMNTYHEARSEGIEHGRAKGMARGAHVPNSIRTAGKSDEKQQKAYEQHRANVSEFERRAEEFNGKK